MGAAGALLVVAGLPGFAIEVDGGSLGEGGSDNGDDGASDGSLLCGVTGWWEGTLTAALPTRAALLAAGGGRVAAFKGTACMWVGIGGGRRGGALATVEGAPCLQAAHFARIFARSESASFEAAIMALAVVSDFMKRTLVD